MASGTVIALETLHFSAKPSATRPRGSDKVYVVSVRRNEDDTHDLWVLFGPRLGPLQERTWRHPSLGAAYQAWRRKLDEQRDQGYKPIDWTDAYYGLATVVDTMGPFELTTRPAATPTQPKSPPKPPPLVNPQTSHAFSAIRDIGNQMVICSICGMSRSDPRHGTGSTPAPSKPRDAVASGDAARKAWATRRLKAGQCPGCAAERGQPHSGACACPACYCTPSESHGAGCQWTRQLPRPATHWGAPPRVQTAPAAAAQPPQRQRGTRKIPFLR